MRKVTVYIALIAVLSSVVATTLNEGMSKIASSDFAQDFNLDYSQLTWVFNSYQITYAVLLPVFGLLGDVSGRRKVLMGGLMVFSIGSALCGFAWNYMSFLACRIMQGVGSAAVFPISVVVATSMFPPEHKGKVMGFWGMALSLGSVVGPSVGGFIARYLGWRYMFFGGAVCGILSLLSIMFAVEPDSAAKKKFSFDLAGTVFLSGIILTLVWVTQNGPTIGWSSPTVLFMLLGFIIFTSAFIYTEKKASTPIIDLRIFANNTFLAGVYCGGTHFVSVMGMQFMMPLFLSQVMGFDLLSIGMILAPQGAVGIVVSPLAGWLEDRFSSKVPVAVGLAIRASALLSFALMTQKANVLLISTILILDGVGAALIRLPSMNAAVSGLPKEQAASVTGVYNMVRYVMASVGTAVIGLILDRKYTPDFVPTKPIPGYFQSYAVLAGMTIVGLALIRFLGKPSVQATDAGKMKMSQKIAG